MQAIYPVKVQGIRSTGRKDRFYVVIPIPLAAAIGLESGEDVHWSLTDRNTLLMKRMGGAQTDRSPKVRQRISPRKAR
jgi:bifunctional DNA-binding transcriptional regulator/antitoxin component of YhaV-PrlF toxin-antitoxin module